MNPQGVYASAAYRPGVTLFVYECVRLLLLVVFLALVPPGASSGGIFPVYLSANALFPMMALFVWLRPEEYGNYLTLHIAGKVIALVSFFMWEIFSAREFLVTDGAVPGSAARIVLILGFCLLLSLTDMVSVWGAWSIKNKLRRRGKPADSAADRGI